MEKVPSSRNDILVKRFGIPMEGYNIHFTYEETIIPHRPRDHLLMLLYAESTYLSRG